MSDPTFQTAIYGRANGSALTVDSGGTVQVLSGGQINIAAGGSFVNSGDQSVAGNLTIASGGSLTVASGGSIQIAAGGMLRTAGTINIGGTAGRWAFGSATLDNGTALVYTGLSQIISVTATPLKTSPGTATTSPSSFQIDPARFGNGTFYALGLAGTFNYAGAGTFVYTAHGF